MNHAYDIVDRYIQSWNETDSLRRRALIEGLYTEQAVYTDPMIQSKGWQAIDATIAALDQGRIRQVLGFLDQVPHAPQVN